MKLFINIHKNIILSQKFSRYFSRLSFVQHSKRKIGCYVRIFKFFFLLSPKFYILYFPCIVCSNATDPIYFSKISRSFQSPKAEKERETNSLSSLPKKGEVIPVNRHRFSKFFHVSSLYFYSTGALLRITRYSLWLRVCARVSVG